MMKPQVTWWRSTALWSVACGALVAAVLVACASTTQPPHPSPVDPRKQELSDYWMQIREWRVDMGMSADPERRPDVLNQPRPVCRDEREPTTEVCEDTCNLKDAICDNAERICRIAGDLGDDVWASGKCKSAKASCREASQKCCECTSRESQAAPVDMDAKPTQAPPAAK